MNDRPTPETDLIEQGMFGSDPKLIADFARRLERERDEARDTILDVLSALKPMHNEGPRLAALRVKEERDEALDAVEKSKAFKRVMKEDNAKLRRERDELNKRLIEVCQYGVVCTIEREDLHKELDEARKELAFERALADRMAGVLFGCTARDQNDAYDSWKDARK